MANKPDEPEDLEALGLIASSYDALFAVRKKVRKINDLSLPTREGITVNQIGVALVMFLVSSILLGFIIQPLFRLLHIQMTWWLLLLFLFGPSVLAAQRVTKPMAYGKSITGTLTSLMRYWLDDPVHRRGLPIKTPARPWNVPILHYQREWVMAEAYAPYVQGEGDYSDEETEYRMTKTPPIELQGWYDNAAIEHIKAERAVRESDKEENLSQVQFRRGTAATVIVPDTEERL